MNDWLVFRAGKQFGPFTNSQLKSLAANGKVLPADVLGRVGSKTRVRADQVTGLFESIASMRRTPISATSSAAPQNQPLRVLGDANEQLRPPTLTTTANLPRVDSSRVTQPKPSRGRRGMPPWMLVFLSILGLPLVVTGIVIYTVKNQWENPDRRQKHTANAPKQTPKLDSANQHTQETASDSPNAASEGGAVAVASGQAVPGNTVATPKSAAAETKSSKTTVKSSAQSPPKDHLVMFDLSPASADYIMVQVENAALFFWNGGKDRYWGPELLSQWATITYVIDLPFALEDAHMEGLTPLAWNKHADKCFDEDAEAFVEVSSDGKEWTTVASTTSSGGVSNNNEWLKSITGKTSFLLRARLFSKRTISPFLRHVQWLRSTPSAGQLPWLTVWGTQASPEDRPERVTRAVADAAKKAKEVAAARQAGLSLPAALGRILGHGPRGSQHAEYTLANGDTTTPSEIRDWNRNIQDFAVLRLRALDDEEQRDLELGIAIFDDLVMYAANGDEDSLRKRMRLLSEMTAKNPAGFPNPSAYVAKLMLNPGLQRAAVPCADGRCLYWQDLWTEALEKGDSKDSD